MIEHSLNKWKTWMHIPKCFKRCTFMTGMVIMLLLLTACASRKELVVEAFEESQLERESVQMLESCCTSFSEFEYKSISRNMETFFLNPWSAPAYEFNTGMSHFAAVELSEEPTDVVFVRSHMLDGKRGQSPRVFQPHVFILDENHVALRASRRIRLCFHRGWTIVGYYGKVDRIPARAKYLVFYADLQEIGESITYSSSATTSAFNLPIETSTQFQVPFAAHGNLDIWLSNGGELEGELDQTCW